MNVIWATLAWLYVYFDNSLIAQHIEPPLDAGIKPPLGSRLLVRLGLNFEVFFLAESLWAGFSCSSVVPFAHCKRIVAIHS
jgi:hypothetical protein